MFIHNEMVEMQTKQQKGMKAAAADKNIYSQWQMHCKLIQQLPSSDQHKFKDCFCFCSENVFFEA